MFKVQRLNSLRTLNIELLNLELKALAPEGSPFSIAVMAQIILRRV
jgi:hypothetical protein